MTAPFRRPPSSIEFIPDVEPLGRFRRRDRNIDDVELAEFGVQLLALPYAPPIQTFQQQARGRELTLDEMLDIRTYDQEIARRRNAFGDPLQTRGRRVGAI